MKQFNVKKYFYNVIFIEKNIIKDF